MHLYITPPQKKKIALYACIWTVWIQHRGPVQDLMFKPVDFKFIVPALILAHIYSDFSCLIAFSKEFFFQLGHS